MIKLTECRLNHVYEFVSFEGARHYQRHLRHLGLRVGTPVIVLKNDVTQPLIVSFKGTKIGLDQDLAANIRVCEADIKETGHLKKLSDIEIGKIVQVVDFSVEGAVKRRLMDMGMTKGTALKIKSFAPLGDPIEINLRGYDLSLRKAEAALIIVKEV